jgi:hypothetical protein
MKLRTTMVGGLLLLLLVAGGVASTAQAKSEGSGGSIASFDGTQIDLSQGWGAARACLVDETANDVECFRTQSELVLREEQLTAAAPANPEVSCSTALKLFANTGYGGQELDFVDRGLWQNLSDWGFSNQTSSYKVGACSVDLADGANGGSPFYPGNTSAGHDEPSMLSGWDNRVSSIYIS